MTVCVYKPTHIKHMKVLQTKTPTTLTQARAKPGSAGQRREDTT